MHWALHFDHLKSDPCPLVADLADALCDLLKNLYIYKTGVTNDLLSQPIVPGVIIDLF